MSISDRGRGVRVEFPDTYEIVDAKTPATPPRRVRRVSGSPLLPVDPAERDAEHQALLTALGNQDMTHVDTIPFVPKLQATSPTGRRSRSAPTIPARQSVHISVDLEPGASAAVLLEQDGLYSWTWPNRVEPAKPAASQTRRARGAGSADPHGAGTRHVAHFTIDLRASTTPTSARAARGVISHFIYGHVRAFVLKFVVSHAIGKAVSVLEQHVQTGLVLMDDADPTRWRAVDAGSSPALPKGRPARVLLFVHGTFSSTIGGFSALGVHPWGQELLRAALVSYDVILGYDHRTLSVDPTENAVDLLTRLHDVFGDTAPEIDVVCHSRGGLVTRALAELVVPVVKWRPRVNRVVFVGVPNQGTLLAEPANWKALVDLYTNLSMSAARALGLIPQAALFASIVNGIVQGLGALVKVISDAAVTDQGVPGLAAMEPDGPYISALNLTQSAQPTPASTWYYVGGSNFEPRGAGETTSELPPRLVQLLADGLVDSLMKEPNDLVVNVSSMGAIDPGVGGFVDDRLDFPANRTVYHCNYFSQPSLVEHMSTWLNLGMSARSLPPAPTPPPPPTSPRVERGSVVGSRLPRRVNTNVMVTRSDARVAELLSAVRDSDPGYLVIRRPRREGGHSYAFRPDEVRRAARGAGLGDRLDSILVLHEDTASPVTTSFDPAPGALERGRPATARRVILRGDDVVGVVSEADTPPSADQIIAAARRIRRGARAVPPASGRPGTVSAPPKRRRKPEPLTHVSAQMPDSIVVNSTASIQVDVSREEIKLVRRAGAADDAIHPDADRPLIIQVLPKANIEVQGTDRVEVPVPQPGQPQQLFFDVKATAIDTAEVWVVIRQDHLPMLTLKLKPTIVARSKAPASTKPLRADAEVPDGPRYAAIPTLTISEEIRGDQTVYRFELNIPELSLLERHVSAPITGDRDAYVQRLYDRIEEDWGTSQERVKDFQQSLRAFGLELLDQLVPPAVQDSLWKYRRKLKSVMVLCDEPFIPWELVHLRAPGKKTLPRETLFLGQLGVVRWLWLGLPPDTLRVRPARARTLIPQYPADSGLALPNTAAEGQYLAATFGATPIDPHPGPVRRVLVGPGSFDLLHFAGHGGATGGSVSDARILLEGSMTRDDQGNSLFVPEELSSGIVEAFGQLRAKDGNRPLVVLNACQAGRMGRQLTSNGGFAKAFLERGAGAFVSSLWSVLDEPASEFTQTFYDSLKNGRTIAEATIAAREQARSAGDATWLAYVVYGNPAATLKTT